MGRMEIALAQAAGGRV